MNPVLALLTAAFLLAGSALAGTITTVEFDSPTLGRPWAFNVYLPDGYEGSDLEYPVIYLLHGTGGDEASWDEGMDVIDDLVASGAISPVIAVAPASGRSWWVDTIEPFETAFVEDLIPHVD
ncbi:MAG: alpha/beta hydrolase-fold protein, partial [Trueperaceae bacterium]|nr:alpha/beta hydrolase-fold protein [Trueperaceae bacterium]